MDSSAILKLRLSRSQNVGPITWRRLLSRYGTAARALAALPDLATRGGSPGTVQICTEAAAMREIDALARLGGRFLFLGDADYPMLLAQLPDAPPALAVLGDIGALTRRPVGVVGARNASPAGLRLAGMFGADLAEAGVSVISGLARGIDGAAHQGALRTGRTVAVIAGGLDKPYPREHARLQAAIAERGAVVAEAPLGTAAQARHFPRRNRIIAGLALGLVVVEAALKSGSLLTARLAADAGRDVFAVPGSPLDARSKGTNGLLRDGAQLAECAADVLAGLPPQPPARAGLAEEPAPFAAEPADPPGLADLRAEIGSLLGPVPADVDEIVRRCQFSREAWAAVLLELEVAGRVETLPGNRVALLDPALMGSSF